MCFKTLVLCLRRFPKINKPQNSFMKKVLLVAALVSLGTLVQAQTKFGAKAGANFYQFGGEDGSDLENQKMKVGFNLGLFANLTISEMFSVQPELLYSNQGSMVKEGDAKYTYNLNYINIPIMAQYNNPSGFYAETGPEIGFLASAKGKMTFDGDSESEDIKDSFKGFNFSWGLGAGFKMANGFGIGARYMLGLANIVDSEDAKVTNNGFHVGVFYTFNR